eukprot:CAMPEP_0206842708 /NCGR_PEP_ID=MMETSP0975-20121206/23093_1 /ASSEMBLY_ACC=CAM_ASM_000399 /TAXON_ID=483370 /ORGANISM="non described non described, Strain CCMP2097" /LENGTH=50 /DNA_ID=CAMNT_0054385231 /DNA_START=96 /DNA_END=244 /DNA_ORIENTATION=+
MAELGSSSSNREKDMAASAPRPCFSRTKPSLACAAEKASHLESASSQSAT